jgi:hypothetical protein
MCRAQTARPQQSLQISEMIEMLQLKMVVVHIFEPSQDEKE